MTGTVVVVVLGGFVTGGRVVGGCTVVVGTE